MKKIIIFAVSILFLGGCSGLKRISSAPKGLFEPNVTHSLFSCLDELHGIEPELFNEQFNKAEKKLSGGNDSEKLHFICLSLHAEANHETFRRGRKLLEEYLADHSLSEDEHLQLTIFIDRLEEDHIMITELQQQIEQLKNIENIIKSRETAQP